MFNSKTPKVTAAVTNPWHFPRTREAEATFGLLESGLVQSVTLFSARRMGKSEFLREDLRPLAESRNWRVFLYDFLDAAQDEGVGVVVRFARALSRFAITVNGNTKAEEVFSRVKKLKIWAFEVEREAASAADVDPRDAIRDSVALLRESGLRCLLLLDEIQELARNNANTPFVAALRMALDASKNAVSVVFTGSSQSGLQRAFSAAKAPFFHYSKELRFNTLGKDFTDFLAGVLETRINAIAPAAAAPPPFKLDRDALWEAFDKRLGRVPQAVREVLSEIFTEPTTPLAEAVDSVLRRSGTGSGSYPELWAKLSEPARAILRAVAAGKQPRPYSRELRVQAGKPYGSDAALALLKRRGILASSGRGIYVFEDTSFGEWIKRDGNVV
jgi:hypothetical protein